MVGRTGGSNQVDWGFDMNTNSRFRYWYDSVNQTSGTVVPAQRGSRRHMYANTPCGRVMEIFISMELSSTREPLTLSVNRARILLR